MEFETPVAAYHVSGEYAMLRAAASQGLMDYETGLVESLVCLARAGSRVILTYGALDYAAWWRRQPRTTRQEQRICAWESRN